MGLVPYRKNLVKLHTLVDSCEKHAIYLWTVPYYAIIAIYRDEFYWDNFHYCTGL